MGSSGAGSKAPGAPSRRLQPRCRSTSFPPMPLSPELSCSRGDRRARLGRIKEIAEHTVLWDLNHPRAGKRRLFNVRILGPLLGVSCGRVQRFSHASSSGPSGRQERFNVVG